MSTQVIQYQTPGPEISADANALLVSVEGMEIDSHEMKVYAVDELKGIKAKANALEAKRTEITGPLFKALKAVNDLFRVPAHMLEQAEMHLKRKIGSYDAQVEAERRAEEARLAELQRKEQQRLAEQAAAQEAAARAEAERLRKESEAAAAAGDAAKAAKLEARADAKEMAGEARAEEIRAQAAATPLAVVLPSAPTVSGISTREEYDFEIVNASLVPDLYKTVDEKKIRGVVRALKAATNIPGVRVFQKRVLAVRA